MLTIDRERAYQRKLDDLWKRYDSLKEQYAKLQRCEVPPTTIRDLIGSMEIHVSAGLKHYRSRLETAADEHSRKGLEGLIAGAQNALECLKWLNALKTCEKGMQ